MKSTVHPFQTDDPRLRSVHQKVLAEQGLDLADLTALYTSKDILAIGWMANFVRERMHGNTTQYAVNTLAADGNSAPSADEIVVCAGDVDSTLRIVERVRKQHAKVKIAAMTAEELAGRANPPGIAKELRSAGADALLGEGSEVFLPAIRRAIWRSAASAGQRADVRKIARDAGLKTPLYVVQRENSAEEQAKELLTLRDAAAPGFAAVSFNPDATTSVSLAVTTGMQEMKQIAIARLALPNVAHIRAYWQMLGGKLIQIALRFGASELDGTELDAGVDAESRRHELAREISAAGREPQAIANVNKVVISV